MHLLIFDDDERIATLIATIARRGGWSAETATHESEFRSLFAARRPDAIVLDLQLGASDGVEQLRYLQEHGYGGAVVLASGVDQRVLATTQTVGRLLGLAVEAVIEKPARAAHVAAVLQNIAQRITDAVADSTQALAPAPAQPTTGEKFSGAAIGEAISGGQMELHLQPIVSTADGKVVSAEALIRWRHPAAGMILPGEFMPIAERDDALIDQLTEWAIQTAVEHHSILAAHGFEIRIGVNVSGRNLRSLDFPDVVSVLLARAGVSPAAICLEITESVALQGVDAAMDVLTRLRLKGVTLAVDDFGTGYSSLEALRRMPFATIKLDRGFIADLTSSHDSLTIVRSVIDLARNLGMTSVAEGVDNDATAHRLIELGADALQGYLFSRPLPIGDFAEWLKGWSTNDVRLTGWQRSPD